MRTIRGTRREAEAWLTAELAARDRGERQTARTETFSEASARWLKAKRERVELATWREYEAHVRLRLVPAFGRLTLRQVTRSRIEDYVAALERDGRVGRKTINNSLIPLRQILQRAVRDGLLAANPCGNESRDDPLKLPYEEPELHVLDRDAVARYLAACPGWYRPLARLLIATGLRIGEAVALDWADVDLDAASIRVSRSRKLGGAIGGTKGDRARLVVLDSATVTVLREHRRATGRVGGPVFATSTGGRLDPSNVRTRGHAVAIARAGLPPIRLHDLRHTMATLAVAAGASLNYVRDQLGHATVRTTERYAHVDFQAHREIAERIAAWRDE
jgi:integrase